MSAYSSIASMRRVQKQPGNTAPRTRSELMCWLDAKLEGFPHHWEIYKEGPAYALRVGRIVSATYVRCLQMTSFDWWLNQIKNHVGTRHVQA